MPGLEEIKDEVHGLSREIAGLRPLVHEVHNNMPRIATALETLARVTEKLESNTEDHKRIHYRITETENHVKSLNGHHDDLERRFEALREDYLVCTTTSKIRRSDAQTGLWARLKLKAAEKAVDLIVVAVVGFFAWMVVFHLAKYPATALIIGKGG